MNYVLKCGKYLFLNTFSANSFFPEQFKILLIFEFSENYGLQQITF